MQGSSKTTGHPLIELGVPTTVKLPSRRAQARRQRLTVLSLVLVDLLLSLVVWAVASVVHAFLGSGELTVLAVGSIVPNVAVWIGLRALLGLYPGYGLDGVEELRRQTYAVAVTLAITTTFAFAFKIGDSLSRLLLILSFLGLAFAGPLIRAFAKRLVRKLGLWGKPVVILGVGRTGARVARLLCREWGLGYRPVAVFDDRQPVEGELIGGVPYGGAVEEAGDLARTHGVDTAIIAMPRAYGSRLARFVERTATSFPSVIVMPDLGGITNSAVVARDLAGHFGVEIKHNLLNPWSRRVKRALDLLGVGVGGLLISPVLLALILLIKLDSPGPALYAQQRVGTAGHHFRCWKFRTMCTDAEQALEDYLRDDPDLRAEWERDQKLRKDPRVTRMGRILRATSLDELPQLWNVLKGEMSLVGPRPIVDAEVERYGVMYDLYKKVTPGISGFWQVGGRSDTGYKERVAMDAYYVRNWSVWLDLVILARTVTVVISRRGAR